MSVNAVIWDKTKGDVCDALTKHKGIVARAAKELNIARYSLYRLINDDPDLYKLLCDLRSDVDEQFLDVAESIILRSMSDYEKRPSNALRATIYTLNSRGKTRGWNNVSAEVNQNDDLKKAFEDVMQTVSKGQSLNLKNEEIQIITDSKS